MTTRRPFGVTLRNKFIAGLVILIPIMLTAKALWWLFTYVDGLAQPIGVAMFGRPIAGLGFVLTIAIVFLAGFLLSAGPLQRILHWFEEMIDDVPLVGSVYGTTKKVLAGFGKEDSQNAFQRFVFARLPGADDPGIRHRDVHAEPRRQHCVHAVRGVHPDQSPVRRGRGDPAPRGRDRHRPERRGRGEHPPLRGGIDPGGGEREVAREITPSERRRVRSRVQTQPLLIAALAMATGVRGLAAQDYDLVLRNGRIVDGTGGPWYRAELAVRGDTIVAIAPRIAGSARPNIDVQGAVIAPGFIDLHTHARRGILSVPTADNYVRQGVTTLVEGPDGSSPVPLKPFLDEVAAARISELRELHRPGLDPRKR